MNNQLFSGVSLSIADTFSWESIGTKIAEISLSVVSRIVLAILIIVIGNKLINLIIKAMLKGKGFKKLDEGAQSFIKSFVKIGSRVVVYVSAAAILGVPMTSVVAVIGSAGLAVGLALQGSLSNFAGGVMILIFKPFMIGDYVTIGEYGGTVHSINIFYTTLIMPDNTRVVIPNTTASNQAIKNVSVFETRRIEITVPVAYATDVEKTKKILLSIATNHSLVLREPEPTARLSGFGDSSLSIAFRMWVKKEDYWDVYFDVMETIKAAFEKCGIEIPFNQLDVNIKNKSDK